MCQFVVYGMCVYVWFVWIKRIGAIFLGEVGRQIASGAIFWGQFSRTQFSRGELSEVVEIFVEPCRWYDCDAIISIY